MPRPKSFSANSSSLSSIRHNLFLHAHRKLLHMLRLRKTSSQSLCLLTLTILLALLVALSLSSKLTKFFRHNIFSTSTHPYSTSNSALNCSSPIRFGDEYGGWSLCRPIPTRSNPNPFRDAIVYTVGIGRNIKWDEGMLDRYHTIHHGWDPTPTASDFFSKRTIPSGFHFHPYGLAAVDGNMTLKLPDGNFDSYTILDYARQAQNGTVLSLPMLTLESMMRKLGHRWLAVLKIDIEGAEFDVINSWYKSKYEIPADQVLIEFHERYFEHQPGHKRKLSQAITKMASLKFDLIMHTTMEYSFVRRQAIASRYKSVMTLRG